MMKRVLHRLYVKVLTWLGLAVDIHSKGKWPSYMLSNFYPHEFEFDGTKCGSIEGFLQAIKRNDANFQTMICALSRKEAKMRSTQTWQKEQNLYWSGKTYNRHGNQYQFLIRRVYRTMLAQCPKFREALKATGDKTLFHTIGNMDPHKTVLTEKEFCKILTELREKL